MENKMTCRSREQFPLFSNKAVVLFVRFFKQASPFEVGIVLENSIKISILIMLS